MKSLGQKGTPSLKCVTEQYRQAKAASDPMVQFCVDQSKAVAASKKWCQMPSLLVKARDVRRASWKAQASKMNSKLKGLDLVSQAQCIVESCESGLANTAQHLAKACVALQREQVRQHAEETRSLLANFSKTKGQEAMPALHQSLPALSSLEMALVPEHDLLLFELQTSQTSSRAKLLTSLAFTNPEQKLGSLLDSIWKNMHATTQAAEAWLPAADEKRSPSRGGEGSPPQKEGSKLQWRMR
eukprot:3346210-Amphidinium_carterae.1